MCPGFRLIAGGLIVFAAVSMLVGLLFSFEADDNIDDLVGVGREKHTHDYMLRCAILTQLDLDRKRTGKNRTAKLICPNSKQKWNGPVSCSQRSYSGTCPSEWGGGAGSESLSFSLLARDVYGIWSDSVHCFACWSTPEVILFSRSFHLLLDPVSPASHTKRSVSAGI